MFNPFSSLYLHIPFCVKRCNYCDFYTQAIPLSDSYIDEYVASLEHSISLASRTGLLAGLSTIYIGGGTPSFIGKQRLCHLIDALVSAVDLSRIAEFTVECNPDSLDASLVKSLAQMGVNRLSIGVQSLDDSVLAILGRVHSADAARAAISAAAEHLDNVSADLICGIMGQDVSTFVNSLEELTYMGLSHISVYPLMVEKETPLCRAVESGSVPDVDEDVQADHMLIAREILLDAGFDHYEVASYAKPGFESKHNLSCWNGSAYLGLGDGAASMLSLSDAPELLQSSALSKWAGDGIAVNEVAVNETAGDKTAGDKLYKQLLEPQNQQDQSRLRLKTISGQAEIEILDHRQALCEDAMLALRTSAGISSDFFQKCLDEVPQIQYAIEQALNLGLVQISSAGSVVPTIKGWLIGNELYELIWNCAL